MFGSYYGRVSENVFSIYPYRVNIIVMQVLKFKNLPLIMFFFCVEDDRKNLDLSLSE